MATTVRSANTSGPGVDIKLSAVDEYVDVDLTGGGYRRVYRAEFLAAVAKELDVVIAVTDKDSLPKIAVRDGEASFDYGQEGHTEPLPEGISPDEMVALGLHLKAHPAVDEGQVRALATLLDGIDSDLDQGIDNAPAYARRLLATGRVTVKEA